MNRRVIGYTSIRGYLQEQSEERGVVFATVTPISNTLGEMYTMLSYLAPDMLSERAVSDFDLTSLELAPEGSGQEQ